MKKRSLAAFCLSAFVLAETHAIAEESVGTTLTIYSTAQGGAIAPEVYRDGGTGQNVPGYALVRQERNVSLDKSRTTIRFSDVAALIDPTTVSFTSLTDPEGTRVIEQNYQFDLVSTEKVLQKYIDNEISVEQQRGDKTEIIDGVLTSTAGNLILHKDDGSVRIVNGYSGIKLPKLPGGLITKPTLVWDIATNKPGQHRTRVAYQTTGITWWADYNFTYSEGSNGNSCKLDAGAWVSILNQSGGSYQEAKLKLIAGDVQRALPPSPPRVMMKGRRAEMAMADAAPAFEEKAFFEYHLYTLGFPTTLPDNSTKQIELFPVARGVPCEKTLLYVGQANPFYNYGNPMVDRNFGVESNKKVDVFISFKNSKENKMGMPLPAGRIRVSKLDAADNSLEFIGEDRIDHTPKNEKVLLKLGSAFDVVGERRQVDFRIDTNGKWMEEDIEIKIRNQKDEPVTVIAKESLYRWSNWRILKNSMAYDKQDAQTIHFPVKLAKGAEGIVRYTVRYTW